MLTAAYIEALLVDAALADAIWEIWSCDLVDDDTAIALWLRVVTGFARLPTERYHDDSPPAWGWSI